MTGQIFKSNTFTTSTTNLSDGGKVIVEQDAFITVAAGKGIVLDPGAWTVTINGAIVTDDDGLSFKDNFGKGSVPLSKLTLGTEAIVLTTGAGSHGVTMGVPLDISNAGLISSVETGIKADSFGPTSAKGFTITNTATGEIVGDTGIDVDTGAVSLTMTVKNAGTIAGTTGKGIVWSGAANIINGGVIDGKLESSNSASTLAVLINNTGIINGDVYTNNGNDVLKNTGLIQGDVNLEDGVNKAINSGEITGTLLFGTGADSLTNTGLLDQDVMMFGGINTAMNSGQINGTISFGSGNDTFTNKGMVVADVQMDAGDNKVTNNGTIQGDVSFKAGNDVFSNTKVLVGDLDMGDGNNTLTLGGSIDGHVLFGAGNDTATVKTTLSLMDLGDGNNTLTNSGEIATLLGGAGVDVIKNSAKIGFVDLKGGDDAYTGSSGVDVVNDNNGNDSYKLGAGDDTLYMMTGIDTCDGGTGMDTLLLSTLGSAQLINLDTKDVSVLGQTLQANSAVSAGESLAAIVKNFENVEAGSSDDVIIGSSGANVINGDNGADVIVGGLGRDVMGGGGDVFTDTFVYLSTKDSGVTEATRDVIVGFKGAGAAGGDVINLKAIDTDAKTNVDEGFDFIGNDQVFTGKAGELRAVVMGTDTVIQADLNGDTKVDFAITVLGAHTFISGDFVL